MISELKTFYRIYADTRNENTGKIVAKQNDTKTRYLDITVTDNGVPVDLTGCEVRIYGRKKDGTEFYNDGTLQDATTGRCLFEATTQMLAYAGQNVNCEIVVFKDNEQILSTMPFDVFVVESLMGANAIESSNEYGALVVLFQNLYEALTAMETMVENFGLPGETAKEVPAATFWQMLEAVYTVNAEALKNASVSAVLEMLNEEISKEKTSNEILRVLNAGVNANFRSPIAVTINNGATLNTNYEMLSGTGRGKLFVYTANEGLVKITIDGNIIVSKSALISGQVVEMEFAESFSVWNVADASGSNYITRALAVFY